MTELYNNILNHLNNPRYTQWFPDCWGNLVYGSGNAKIFSKTEGVPIFLWTHYDAEKDPELDATLETPGLEIFGWKRWLPEGEIEERNKWCQGKWYRLDLGPSGSHFISTKQLRGRFPLRSIVGEVIAQATEPWKCPRCNGVGYFRLSGVPLAGGYDDCENCPRCGGAQRIDGFIPPHFDHSKRVGDDGFVQSQHDYAAGADIRLRRKGVSDMNMIPAFVPVIHPTSRKDALASIQCAVQCGVDGIFLINQGMKAAAVFDLSERVKDLYPDLWIGLNILGESPAITIKRLGPHINGLWTDNAGIDERAEDLSEAKLFQKAREELDWKGLYYGGVDFKGQRRVPFSELGKAAVLATPYVDVVTTSGRATGEAADIERVKAMRAGLGDYPMALASGVTPKNVHKYLPYVDSFLVASGIEKRFGILDPLKTTKLAELIHAAPKRKIS